MRRRWAVVAAGLVTAVGLASPGLDAQKAQDGPGTVAPAPAAGPETYNALVGQYCVGCHNPRTKSGNLVLEGRDVAKAAADAVVWEKVVRKLRAGVMPPAGARRPDEATADAFSSWLERGLDDAARRLGDPGRPESLHRLNRAEYQNVIRDLLALEIDVAQLLPADDASFGFDNVADGLKISQSLLEGYLAAGKRISRAAVGTPPPAPDSRTYNVSDEVHQHDRVGDLPLGTRGGTLVRHFFPTDGEYDIRLELSTGGMRPGQVDRLEFAIDGEPVRLFTIDPNTPTAGADAGPRRMAANRFDVRLPIKAGPHAVTATFYRTPVSIVEDLREPFPNPGLGGGPVGPQAELRTLRIVGPMTVAGPGDTPSRRRIFVCQPSNVNEEHACAQKILATLARRAFRRAVRPADIEQLFAFYERGRREDGSFESGVEFALWRLLVSPDFLYRIETPAGAASQNVTAKSPAVYPLSGFDLASRLSFFLWSSMPDDDLLTLAESGRLHDPAVLDRQVRRMLADPRAAALTENFAGQWLQLRNLDRVQPGDPYFRGFDETLRASMRRETELLFDSVVRENRGVVELLNANYTFLDERLALHYGITNVQGSHFRRVPLPADSPRRGVLGHASVLTLTSHAIRTSPVLRGKWILLNILGTPPPEPPPGVPALEEKRTPERQLTMRERMAQHRKNPTCAGCHSMIDPAGFALENFDAIGRWRLFDESYNRVDTAGSLPDGTKFSSFAEFRDVLVRRPDRLATTLAERFLIYGLGRGLESYDMPVVRQIVRDAAKDGYRLQSIVAGVVKSYPFLMRRSGAEPLTATAKIASAR